MEKELKLYKKRFFRLKNGNKNMGNASTLRKNDASQLAYCTQNTDVVVMTNFFSMFGHRMTNYVVNP